MIEHNGTRSTFLRVYKQQGIFIPKIQRDYVQGRQTAQVRKNRKSLLNNIVDVLKGNVSDIMLNFVYGYQEKGFFVPIDGQQRLTTLFLLHVYLFAKTNGLHELENGEKFRYDTRETTNRFFDALFENNNIEKFLRNVRISKNTRDSVEEFVKQMEDCAWFSSSWKNDPTIYSCMIMLGEIHAFLADYNKDCYVKMVSRLKYITFMQLDITQDIGKANQLYIRMNARGKQLTAFENFKADMYGDIEREDVKSKLVDHIDGDWLQLIWSIGGGASEKYCDVFYRELLHWLILNHFIAKGQNLEGCAALLEKGKDIEQIYFDEYKELDKHTLIDAVGDIYYALHILQKVKETDEKYFEEKIQNEFFNYTEDKRKYNTSINTYPNRLRLYAVVKFGRALELLEQDFCIEQFKAWYRIINNLITNSEIDKSEKLQAALGSLKKIHESKILDVNMLDESDFKNIFKEHIIKEEIFKQKIISQSNDKWKNLILTAETMPFFEGEILFIFKVLDIDEENKVNGKDGHFKATYNAVVKWTEMGECTLLRLLYSHMKADDCFYKENDKSELRFYINKEPHHNYDVRGLLRENKGIEALKSALKDMKANYDNNPEDYANDRLPKRPPSLKGNANTVFVNHLIYCYQIIEYCEQGRFYERDDKIYLIKRKNQQNMPEYLSYMKSLNQSDVTLNYLPNTYNNIWQKHTYDYKERTQAYKIEYSNGEYKANAIS